MDIKERLKKIRNCLHLTQQEFAYHLGVTRNTVATYETGKSNPSDAAVALICREFNVNEDWLRNGTGEMFLQKDKAQIIIEFAADIIKESDSFKMRLFEALAKLNHEDWKVIERIFDELSNAKTD